MQNLTGKGTGDDLTAVEWNQLPQEVQNVITDTGQTLTDGDLNQLGKGAAAYAAVSDYYTDSGVANAYVLSPISGFQAPVAYFDGMRARFFPSNANSGGTATVNINGLGVRDIVRQDGVGMSSDTELQLDILAELVYSSTDNNFKLTITRFGSQTQYGSVRYATTAEAQAGSNSSRAISPLTLQDVTSTTTRSGVIELATQAEVDTGTDPDKAVTPATLQQKLTGYFAWSVADTISMAATETITAVSVTGLEIGTYSIQAQVNGYLNSVPTSEVIDFGLSCTETFNYAIFYSDFRIGAFNGASRVDTGVTTFPDTPWQQTTTDSVTKIDGIIEITSGTGDLDLTLTTDGISAEIGYASLKLTKIDESI